MTVLWLAGRALEISLAYMTCVRLLSLVSRNAGIVDSFGGPGFALLAVALPALTGGPAWRSLLVLGLVV